MIPNEIIVHHSASRPSTTVTDINAWHFNRHFSLSSLGYYVGYHYVVDSLGVVTQTRRDGEIGCHTIPNDGKIGICLIGDFTTETPSDGQIAALFDLIERLKKDYNITSVKGHRDCNRTECPGENLYKLVLVYKISWLQKLINILLKKP